MYAGFRGSEKYIRDNTGYDVITVDTLKAVNRFLDKTVCDSYRFMAKRVPAMFGRLYQTDQPAESVFPTWCPSSADCSATCSTPPSLGITLTSYLPPILSQAEMVSDLKADGTITAPLICILTDYGVHRAWIAPNVDAYVVASEDMVPELVSFGVPKEKIYPFGIPVHGVFFDREDRDMILRDLRLDPKLPTLLFMAGSFGVSNIIKLYRDLEATDVKMQIIVITGRNQKLYEAFEKELAQGEHIPTRLIYFTEEVEKYMHASDLLVTKPGGLTVSEALACNLPMAVFDAIPGQEEDNANFLKIHDMGVRLQKDGNFAEVISSLLLEKEKLQEMRDNCKEFDKSQSIPNLLALIRELVEKEA